MIIEDRQPWLGVELAVPYVACTAHHSHVAERLALSRCIPACQRESKILTAAWNADTCSLAIATAAGGVKIYGILPTPPPELSSGSGSGSGIGSGSTARSVIVIVPGEKERQQHLDSATAASATISPPTRPATAVLRHEIVINTISTTADGGRKRVNRQVSSLATSSDGVSWEDFGGEGGDNEFGGERSRVAAAAGAGVLVGVAEGQHLCVWDLATGSTLLTALSIAPRGCTVEKVLWHGPTALVALLYHDGTGVSRVDVHQVDVGRKVTIPVRGISCVCSHAPRLKGLLI